MVIGHEQSDIFTEIMLRRDVIITYNGCHDYKY